MNHRLHSTARIASGCLLSISLLTGSAAADKFLVWVDEAHTRQTEVEKLDPDEIADPSSFSLGFGHGIGQVGVSVGWSREQGVKYDEQVQRLIDEIRALCKEFNHGELSLEAYQQRMRGIFASVETARLARMELMVHNAIEANKAGSRLDEQLGLPPADNAAFEARIGAALDSFRALVESIPPDEVSVPRDNEIFDGSETETLERSRRAVSERLSELDRSLTAKPIRRASEVETVTIWADKARTRQITVPKLDVEGLVEDFQESLCVQMKYSAPLISQYVGPDIRWALDTKAKYDEAAKQLIVKYKRLCLEYNGGILSREGYTERLLELMEAERRAFAAREAMAQRLSERADAMRAELQKRLGAPASGLESGLRALRDKKRADAAKRREEKAPDSAVESLSQKHREQMAAWDEFVVCVGQVAIQPPSDPIEVWVDDARTRQVKVPRLDTDLIAESVKTRITLHISFFDFGPECAWAQDKGLEYGHAAQELIVKSKQLCMDYNAGLVSQETFERRSRQIDASVEKAAEVRDEMAEMLGELKGAARDKLDRQLELQGHGSGKRGG